MCVIHHPELLLKLYIPEKKAVIVLKTLVLDCVWPPSLLHPQVMPTFGVMHMVNVPGSPPP